jgi:3-isopropylmalate/(R)-2-methylmalate dehydratase small subunit
VSAPFPSPLTSRVIPLPYNDVDTDQIIPARYLKVTDKKGLAEGLFYEWRYLPDGSPRPGFPLNFPEYQGAQIILAGDNFGCGSSREHAPWALTSWGIRAVISTRFADIFYNNAIKHGLLLVLVDAETQRRLFNLFANDVPASSPTVIVDPSLQATIDLQAQTLVVVGAHGMSPKTHFPLDPFDKHCLLEGVDQLGYLLKFADQICAYEHAHGIT